MSVFFWGSANDRMSEQASNWATKQRMNEKKQKCGCRECTWFAAHLCAFWSDGFQNISRTSVQTRSQKCVRISYIWFSHFSRCQAITVCAVVADFAATAAGKTHRIRIQRIRKFHLYHFSLAPFTHSISRLLFPLFSRTFGSSISYYFGIFSTIISNVAKYSSCKSICTCKNMQISRFKHKFH